MTIKSSGQLSISEIVAEFGGTAPHSLSEYIRGGSLVPNSPANSSIPTTTGGNSNIMMSDFYGADVTPAALTAADITMVGRTYAASSVSGTATVILTLRNDGDLSVNHTADVAPAQPGAAEWLRRTNNAPDINKAGRVQVRVTRTGGFTVGFSGAALNTWHSLSTSRSWTLSGSASRLINLSFEFREGTSGSLKTVPITLDVN